ncbi:hypothetical protein ACVI1N_004884 [Sinorhizobium medicae]
MKRSKFTEEQIISILREQEAGGKDGGALSQAWHVGSDLLCLEHISGGGGYPAHVPAGRRLGRHHALSKDRRDHRGHAYSRGEQGACWTAGDSFDPRHFDDPEIFDSDARKSRTWRSPTARTTASAWSRPGWNSRWRSVRFSSAFPRCLAVARKELKLRTPSTASACCLLALDGLAKSNRLDAVVIARYIADFPTLEMLIDPLREKPIRQHRKICSSGGTPTAVA